MIDQQVLSKLKQTQNQMARQWRGMEMDTIGRPGTLPTQNPQNAQNKKLQEYVKLEDERFKYFSEAICKLKDFDYEYCNPQNAPDYL